MFTAALLVAISVPADAPKLSDEAKKELAKFDGKWKVVEFVKDGNSMKADAGGPDFVIEFNSGKVKVSYDGKVLQEVEVASLDPKPDPKIIDMKAKPKDPKSTPLVEEGVYKFEKDRLYICAYKGKDKRRPTSFETKNQDGMELIVLERIKG